MNQLSKEPTVLMMCLLLEDLCLNKESALMLEHGVLCLFNKEFDDYFP